MRRFFLILVVMLVSGGIIGLLMNQDTGYVLISYNHISIEASIWVFAVAVIFALFILSWCKDIVVVMLRPGSFLGKMTGAINDKKASKNTINGLFELMGGNWAKAEKLLTHSAKNVPYPLINYIGAAYAASEQDAYERSKNLLRSAHQVSPDAEFVVSFAQSQIQMRQRHFENALATLLRLHKIQPKHRQVLKMLVQAYSHLNDWDALLALTPTLKKEGILDESSMLELEKKAFQSLLDSNALKDYKKTANNSDAIKKLENAWQKISSISHDNSMRTIYAQALIQFGEEQKAESFIRKSLQQDWCEELILIYGLLAKVNTQKALHQAENWLTEKPNSPELLLTCGRLSQQQKLWGKAKDYYQASIKIDANNAATAELSRLLNALGDYQGSQTLFAQALNSLDTLTPLPLPSS